MNESTRTIRTVALAAVQYRWFDLIDPHAPLSVGDPVEDLVLIECEGEHIFVSWNCGDDEMVLVSNQDQFPPTAEWRTDDVSQSVRWTAFIGSTVELEYIENSIEAIRIRKVDGHAELFVCLWCPFREKPARELFVCDELPTGFVEWVDSVK